MSKPSGSDWETALRELRFARMVKTQQAHQMPRLEAQTEEEKMDRTIRTMRAQDDEAALGRVIRWIEEGRDNHE